MAAETKEKCMSEDLLSELNCQMCPNKIPLKRAINRALVCSDECRKKMRVFRAKLVEGKRCPLCYRPCTHEEIEIWKELRRRKGPLQQFLPGYKGGGMNFRNVKELRAALGEAVEALEHERDIIAESNGVEVIDGQLSWEGDEPDALADIRKLTEQINRWKSLVESTAKRQKKKQLDADPVG